MVRYIEMDVQREFAQLAAVENGLVRDRGPDPGDPEALRQWAAGLSSDDRVALEATGGQRAGSLGQFIRFKPADLIPADGRGPQRS